METEIFKSDDMLFSAFLLVKGASLIEIKETYSGHFEFHFKDLDYCLELKGQYLNNAEAPAKELFHQREILLSEIKNRDRNGDKQHISIK